MAPAASPRAGAAPPAPQQITPVPRRSRALLFPVIAVPVRHPLIPASQRLITQVSSPAPRTVNFRRDAEQWQNICFWQKRIPSFSKFARPFPTRAGRPLCAGAATPRRPGHGWPAAAPARRGGCLSWQAAKAPREHRGRARRPAPLRAAAVACHGGERILGKATSVRPAKALSTHAAAARTPPASTWHFQHKLVASKHAGKPTHCPRKPTRQKAALAEIRLLFPHCQVSPSAGRGSEPESHRRRRSRGQGALAGGELASRN